MAAAGWGAATRAGWTCGGWAWAGWFQAKVVLVFVMSGVHGMLAQHVREFGADENQYSQKYFRIVNEIPTILMIAIVLLVVLKPF